MDNRYDMQYFSSAAVLELLKTVSKLRLTASYLGEVVEEVSKNTPHDNFLQEDIKEMNRGIAQIERITLLGNEMIYEENDGLLYLVNAFPEGRPNQHLLFWDETEVQKVKEASYTEGFSEGSKLALDHVQSQDAKIMEQANRIEALEDELAQLRT